MSYAQYMLPTPTEKINLSSTSITYFYDYIFPIKKLFYYALYDSILTEYNSIKMMFHNKIWHIFKTNTSLFLMPYMEKKKHIECLKHYYSWLDFIADFKKERDKIKSMTYDNFISWLSIITFNSLRLENVSYNELNKSLF